MKTILVLLDGLNYTTANRTLGHLKAMCKKGLGQSYIVRCELPALSRPLYECVLTGVTPVDSGIVNNCVTRLSNQQSIFHYARAAGLTTAAAAYHWISELYNRTPFIAARDRHTDDEQLTIQHGHFYYVLFIHSMNIDDAGHRYGQNTSQYRDSARSVDSILSEYLANWLQDGYQVIITADHGMDDDGNHCADTDEESLVPFFVFGDGFSLKEDVTIAQTEICGTVCQLLNIPHDKPYCRDLLKE